jgi:hypothetical protein
VGHIIAYEYLWRSKAGSREDGEKVYPAAVVLARRDLGPTPVAYVLGISHMPPDGSQRAIQVPRKLKRFLGLDDEPSWIYTDQVNVFVWPGPDLRAADGLSRSPAARGTCVVGALPGDWFRKVTRHLAESQRLGRVKTVKRTV